MNQGNPVIDMDSVKNSKLLGHQLIDNIGDFLDSIKNRLCHNSGESPVALKALLGEQKPALRRVALLTRFWAKHAEAAFQSFAFKRTPEVVFGYIIFFARTVRCIRLILLASIVNPKCRCQYFKPDGYADRKTNDSVACRINRRVDVSYGGILVSGGNMANITAFLTACKVKGLRSRNDLANRTWWDYTLQKFVPKQHIPG